MSEVRRGFLFGLGAYTIWGFFPLYIRLLLPSTAMEILAHRVVWSVAFIAIAIAVAREWALLRPLLRQPKTLAGLSGAAALVAINWGAYIYGVNAGRVVETSLGYFILPLVSMLLGVTVLRERPRPAQWAALGVGAVAVAVLTINYGRLPYIALSLAFSFGVYGLVKKHLALPATPGLLVESVVLALPAVVYLGWLSWRGESTFGHISVWHTLLLILLGAASAVPLLLFAGAANRLSLTTLGILQYTAPILQLGSGLLIFHEPMPPVRLAGFMLVWLALAVFTVDAVRNARRLARTPDAAGNPAAVGR